MLGISTKFPDTYRVETPVYQGPLDLLLQLIEKAELDITKLALAQVTDQYLRYIRGLNHLETNEISLFLVIASKLLQIKSSVLLPRPSSYDEDGEEVGDELVQQLIEYKKFRELAKKFNEREQMGLKTYLRLAPPPKPDKTFDPSGINLQSLKYAARDVFTRMISDIDLQKSITQPRYSIRLKMTQIVDELQKKGNLSFYSLLISSKTRIEIVVTFLALLELIKQRLVEVQQENLFTDIVVNPTDELYKSGIVETEFED